MTAALGLATVVAGFGLLMGVLGVGLALVVGASVVLEKTGQRGLAQP